VSVRLSAAIMAHPSRLGAAARLRETLADLAPEVIVDPDPDGPPSPARTAVRAWAAAAPDATHHLVLQDDARPAAGFAAAVRAAVAARPDDALCLFTEWASLTSYAVRLAAARGEGWARVCDPYTPTVALVLPARAARAVADATPSVPQDDVLVTEVRHGLGLDAWAVVPNLVEHDTGPSLAGNGRQGLRRSACFVAAPAAVVGAACDADLVPCFSRSFPRPFFLARDVPGGWRPVPVAAGLARRGIDPDGVGPRAARAAARLVRRHPSIRPDLAAGMWLTAWLLGVETGRPAGVYGRVGLATLGPGLLDQYLPADDLRGMSSDLTAYAQDAFATGAADRTEAA